MTHPPAMSNERMARARWRWAGVEGTVEGMRSFSHGPASPVKCFPPCNRNTGQDHGKGD
jgi:hypothetical protein